MECTTHSIFHNISDSVLSTILSLGNKAIANFNMRLSSRFFLLHWCLYFAEPIIQLTSLVDSFSGITSGRSQKNGLGWLTILWWKYHSIRGSHTSVESVSNAKSLSISGLPSFRVKHQMKREELLSKMKYWLL